MTPQYQMIITMIFGVLNQAFIRSSWCPCGKREFLESNYIDNKDENKLKMLCHLEITVNFSIAIFISVINHDGILVYLGNFQEVEGWGKGPKFAHM